MGNETVNPIVVLTIIFGTGIVIAVSIAWLEHRTRVKALDVLKAYAQRGDEPPASVVEAIAAVGSGHKPAPQPGRVASLVQTRADHLGRLAAMIVAALGSAGIAWWRIPHDGEPGGLAIVAMFAAVFFSMSAAARLVAAFSAPQPILENMMAHVAANFVGVLGTVGIAWWRMPSNGEPGGVVIFAVIAAIFLAAMLAWSLVGMFSGRSRNAR
jgi:hypothetical protein